MQCPSIGNMYVVVFVDMCCMAVDMVLEQTVAVVSAFVLFELSVVGIVLHIPEPVVASLNARKLRSRP